jgi:hypothetical protein
VNDFAGWMNEKKEKRTTQRERMMDGSGFVFDPRAKRLGYDTATETEVSGLTSENESYKIEVPTYCPAMLHNIKNKNQLQQEEDYCVFHPIESATDRVLQVIYS